MVHQERINFDTTGHRQMDDLTDQVAAIVERSGVTTGIVQVCCVGSTAAVDTIEFEPGLERDLPEMLDRLHPAQPRLRPRAGVARRQRPLPLAGHAPGAVALSARGRGQAGAGNLAAGFPSGVRRSPTTAYRGGDGHGGVASYYVTEAQKWTLLLVV